MYWVVRIVGRRGGREKVREREREREVAKVDLTKTKRTTNL